LKVKETKWATVVFTLALSLVCLLSCKTGEEAFVGDRLLSLCDEAYWICGVAAGCVLNQKHYVEGVFPGVRRVVVVTKKANAKVQVRLFFSNTESPGTELLVQLYEPDCTVYPDFGQAHLIDVDLFDEAGDDRTLVFNLEALEIGEHLLEIYSDASIEYLLVVDLS
jgi:hypothetical protein